MDLVTPNKLKVGDHVWIVSPSAGFIPFVKARVQRAKKNLEDLGLIVKFAPYSQQSNGYVSATIEERVSDVHAAFSDPECKLIMASIGGNHSNQLLKLLDYELIKQNPKLFVGYSDITVLHYALATQAQLRTYYGPCLLPQFGEFPSPLSFTLTSFLQTLFENGKSKNHSISPSTQYTDEILDWFKGEDHTRPRQMRKNNGYEWWTPGQCSGWALPATIPSLNHLLGTIYLPDTDNAVLFLDIPEGKSIYEPLPVSEVDALMTNLDNAGVLPRLNGLVIGRPYRYSRTQIQDLRQVLMRIVKPYGYPILFNVDVGHTDPMLTIPIGVTVQLDSEKNNQQLRIISN